MAEPRASIAAITRLPILGRRRRFHLPFSLEDKVGAVQSGRTLVLLSLGKHAIERVGPAVAGEPQPHWREVANLTGGIIESWATASARRGHVFNSLFRSRPLWGAAVSAAVDAGKFDQIYALDEDCGFRAALLLKARGWKGRLVCLVHHLSPARKRVVSVLRDAPFSHFFVYTHTQHTALLAAGVPENRITCAPIPADTNFFAPAAPRPGRPGVIAVGAAERDYTTLFRAARFIDADIEVFGHGYAGANAAGLIPGELPPNVLLMPHVAVSELRDRLAAARVAVLPLMPVAFAAGATVLTESMSSGVPVVVTRIPGIASYIDAARPGPAVPPGDAEALGQAISQLLNNESEAQAIGRANRRWALKHAQIEDFAKSVLSALNGKSVPVKHWQ